MLHGTFCVEFFMHLKVRYLLGSFVSDYSALAARFDCFSLEKKA